jgi:pyruvate/2-oxoglutarate/acetoin dehydrogenase E1 component
MTDDDVTVVAALNRALHDALAEDDRVMLLGEDVGRTGGVFRVSAGLLDRFGAERVVDMPVAEAGTVGAAVGLCLAGFRPIVELQFDAFVYPAFEQVVTHVARYQWRTGGAARMPMVLRIPFGGGIHAPELHSESPEALFAHLPGLKVVCPATPDDAYALLRWAVQAPDPVVLMEPKRLYRSVRGPCRGDGPADSPHTLRIARPGDAATVVSYGSMVPVCLQAASLLQDGGTSVEVLDLRSLYPLDEDALVKSVARTGRCVVVHEAPRFAGMGAEVAALVAERALLSLQAPVLRVTGIDVPFPLYVHEDDYLPSAQRVATAVQQLLEF